VNGQRSASDLMTRRSDEQSKSSKTDRGAARRAPMKPLAAHPTEPAATPIVEGS
jgi:hypothetical protein